MELFKRNNRKGGFMDEIRCDEPSYLIWKWHPAGVKIGEGNRENAIRWGSSLRVKDGEVAVFVYRQKNGTMQDFIEGPFNQVLKTANLPVLASIIGLAVAVRGTVSFNISDYKEFIKLHRLSNFSLEDFQKQIRDAVCRYVKDRVANAPAAHSIPVIQLETKTAQINDAIEYDISERLKEHFGVLVSGVDIAAIEIDKASDGYRQLIEVTKDITTKKIQAETTDYVERLRIQREEGQYAQHKATQTANIGALQVEKQAEVGVAGAAALGQMSANGAGNVNLGGGDGFNMAAMMASMAVGGAVGQNIAGAMNNMMDGIHQPAQSGITPPPIPTVEYHVAVNGQSIGPFDTATLAQMAVRGQLTADSFVWKNGMAQWKKAREVDDLKSLFPVIPPIPSSEN